MGEHPVDPLNWFAEGELDRCPFCGERAVVRTDAKLSVCLACQAAWMKDGEPHPI